MGNIKFRGKRVDNGEWVYGYLVKGDEGGCYIFFSFCESCLGDIEPNDLWFVKVDCKTIGQYAGIKDKKNQEIYKGDVLKIYRARTAPMANNEINKIIVVKDIRNIQEYDYRWCDVFEVIGNIYDNPELLNNRR